IQGHVSGGLCECTARHGAGTRCSRQSKESFLHLFSLSVNTRRYVPTPDLGCDGASAEPAHARTGVLRGGSDCYKPICKSCVAEASTYPTVEAYCAHATVQTGH